MLKVTKRDGNEVTFHKGKITAAVEKAMNDVGYENIGKASDIADKVTAGLIRDGIEQVTVHGIEKRVEGALMDLDHDVARSYIEFRHGKDLKRQAMKANREVFELLNNKNEYMLKENSNKDSTVLSTKRDYMAGIQSKEVAERILYDKDLIEAHKNGIIHIHDMDYIAMPMHNCDDFNLNDMLQNGTIMNGTAISKPKSLATAVTLTTQIVLQLAANQYGGQTFSVSHLAPFVRISWEKHLKEVRQEGLDTGINYTDEQINRIAKRRLNKEIKDAIQTLQYQLISCAVTNGQAPFVSVFMWINENPEYRDETVMLIKEILKQRRAGIPNKNGVPVTIAFPKLLYVLDETNTYEGQAYYWLTKEYAVPCTIERMVPDYISAKKMREYKGDVFGCMGCVAKDEVITYRMYGKIYVESFSRAWARLSEYNKVKVQPNGTDFYMNLSNTEIYDSKKEDFVKCLRIIKNHNSDWERLTFSNGRVVTVTNDHPFETENRGVVHAANLKPDDIILVQKNPARLAGNKTMDIDKAWLYGLMLCNSAYAGSVTLSLGIDETDIKERFVEVMNKKFGIDVNVIDQHRGHKGNYVDLRLKSGSGKKDEKVVALRNRFISMFEGFAKLDRHIPNEVFEWDDDAKYSFLAGMIDADGYVNSKKRMPRVQIGSTNKELAIQQMLLAQELGMRAGIYANHYRYNLKDAIRYRVEFVPDAELIKMMTSEKKKNHFKEIERSNDSISLYDEASLTKREFITDEDFSYDVTTESEHFSVSGIYSHNCRSFLTPDDFSDHVGNIAKAKDFVPGQHKYYGRFNQGVCTLNLADVALSAHDSEEEFWKLMEERSELVYRVLMIRHKTLLGTKSDVAPILWQNGALARLEPGEVIDPLLFDGYSTISFGYTGLYECTMAMKGCSHTSEEGRDFAMKVMQFINDKCAEWKAETNIAFSPYGTPEENTTDKFAKALKKRFGIVKGITDHDYVTNSYHVNPAEPIDAFSKLSLEGQFQKLSQGGCISYVELPSMKKNPDAVMKIVQHIYENTMYAEINLKLDYCQKCGFEGEMKLDDDDQYRCPNCGNEDYKTMNITRRVCGYLSTNWPVSHGRFSDLRARVLHLEDESFNLD